MTENQSPWLSTKHPPKQKPNARRHHIARGPLSRKLPPLQMTSGHKNFLSRFTQNSPPPVQLKLARKQSSLMDYFGSSDAGNSKPQRSLDFGDVKESIETATSTVCEDLQHQVLPHKKRNEMHSPLKQTTSETLLSVELISTSDMVNLMDLEKTLGSISQRNYHSHSSSSSNMDSKQSPVKRHRRTSPLKERQLSYEGDFVSDSFEKGSDSEVESYSSLCSMQPSNSNPSCTKRLKLSQGTSTLSTFQSNTSSFETVDKPPHVQSHPATLSSTESLDGDLMDSEISRETPDQKTKNISTDFNKSCCARDKFLRQESQSLDRLDTDSRLEFEPSLNTETFDSIDLSHQTQEIHANNLPLESSFNQCKSKKKRQREYDDTEKLTEFDLLSDMFLSTEAENGNLKTEHTNCLESDSVECDQTDSNTCVGTDTFDLNSQLTYNKDSLPLIPGGAEATDLNLSTESPTLAFTADSQSLEFSEDSDSGESGRISVSIGSTLDEVCEDKTDRVQYLKAKHMAQMGTLSFTQTQTFSM